MPRAWFAVLAHDNRPGLDEFLWNLRTFAPDVGIALYNGGRDAGLFDGVDAAVCPASRPLPYGNLVPFHHGVMSWLRDHDPGFELLMTVEPDMVLIKPGIVERLDAALGDNVYAGASFGPIAPGVDIHDRGSAARWQQEWEPLLGLEAPYHCINPGQTFRRDYVDAVLAWPRLAEALARAETSRMFALEELLWPSLAVALGLGGAWHPSSRSITVSRHSPAQLLAYLDDPDCHFVHRAGKQPDDPERRFVRELSRGRRPDLNDYDDRYLQSHHPPLASLGRKVLPVATRARAARAYRRLLGR